MVVVARIDLVAAIEAVLTIAPVAVVVAAVARAAMVLASVAIAGQIERWDHRDTSTIPHLSSNNTGCIVIRNYERIAE